MNYKANFEKVPYNRTDFPIYIGEGEISQIYDFSSHTNWHNDIEFVKIIKGHIWYNVNGKIIKLKTGEGLFINSKQIHYNFANDSKECKFICLAFQPMLFCHSKEIEQKYITPILTNPSISFYVFKGEKEWEKRVLDCIGKIYDSRKKECFELKLHSCFFEIWAEIYKHLGGRKTEISASYKHDVAAFKDMIAFIQVHYKEKISLKDIAFSGNMCKTSCYTVFKKFTGRTPIEYLNFHRLRRSIELMKKTDMNLTEICYESGFSGSSYFAESFRKTFGCSPSEYKKRKNV